MIVRRLRRFHSESLASAGESITLRGDEAHHVLNVVRVRVGEEVALFDGRGHEAKARLLKAGRGEATLEVLAVEKVDREAARELVIACALPRSARMDFLVEKCCELGVRRLVPMVTKRGVVNPTARQENRLRHWRRIAVEAAKQSGRTRLMQIDPVIPFQEAVGGAPDAARMVASPERQADTLAEFAAGLAAEQSVFALIGPEGGFTPEEVELAKQNGFSVVSLGARILRVETAAVAVAACLLLYDRDSRQGAPVSFLNPEPLPAKPCGGPNPLYRSQPDGFRVAKKCSINPC